LTYQTDVFFKVEVSAEWEGLESLKRGPFLPELVPLGVWLSLDISSRKSLDPATFCSSPVSPQRPVVKILPPKAGLELSLKFHHSVFGLVSREIKWCWVLFWGKNPG